MLDRIKGRIAFICDECQDGLETDEYEFDDALKYAKEQGWKSIRLDEMDRPPKTKVGQKYANICSHCCPELEI